MVLSALRVSRLCRGGAPTLAAGLVAIAAAPAPAQSVFGTAAVDPSRFVLVAAPIGSGERSQLNIYEQVSNRRPCFAIGSGRPAAVDPLLAGFDHTGICKRYLESNAFSVRVAGSDLGTTYRLTVLRVQGDVQLLALPTRAGAGPEMLVARTGGSAGGFLKLDLEPGWRLMRRTHRGRELGHVYLYADAFPGSAAAAGAPGDAAPTTPAASLPPLPPAP